MDEVIDVAPLTMVHTTDMELKKHQTPHAAYFEGTSVGKSSNPTLDKIKEDGRYVDRAIRNLVYRVLNEDVPVAGISRPLSKIVPSTHDDEVEKTTDVSKSDDAEDNLHTFSNTVLKDARISVEANIETSSAQKTFSYQAG